MAGFNAMGKVVCGAPSKWYRVLCSRRLHLWCPPNPPSPLPAALESKVTKLARGIGFTVVYTTSSSSLWLLGEHPPISGHEHGLLEVSLPRQQHVKQVAVGRGHVVAMTTTGTVYSMGLNSFGQCGVPPTSPRDQLLPLEPLQLTKPVAKVCCGLDHTHFLSTEGHLFSCGWSDDGQTGTGYYGNVTTPTEVVGDMTTEIVRDVHCRADSSLALTDTNSLYSWGNNEYKQLALHSDNVQVPVPQRVMSPPDDSPVVAITTGYTFSAVGTRHGVIYYTGRLGGIEEEEGEGEGEGRWKVLYRHSGGDILSLSSGLHYLAAVCRDERGNYSLLFWGRHHTATGYGVSSLSLSPTQAKLPSSVLDWSAGPQDCCLLME